MTGWEKVPAGLHLDRSLSPGARALYPVLRYLVWQAGGSETQRASLPPEPEIAATFGCSRTALRGYIIELSEAGWIDRDIASGKSTIYAIHDVPGTDSARTDSEHDRVRIPNTAPSIQTSTDNPPVGPPTVDDPEALVPLRHQRIPAVVDRVPVKASEGAMALAVLDEWNRQAGQALRAKEHVAKIIMRLREYPEATLADHARIIRANLAAPWWKGSPSPAVIYGNGSIFESSIQTVIDEGKPQKARVDPTATRYGRGLTTRQILDDAGVTLTMAEILDGGLTGGAT